MGKVKKVRNKNTYNYNSNKKKIKRKLRRKDKPQIECPQIRKAWNEQKTAKKNLQEMGLLFDTKGVLPIQPVKHKKVPESEPLETSVILKPYVVKELEAEASAPRIDRTTCSTDIIAYVHHMMKEHRDDYKAMARDEKNYYQDTPKQIKRKVEFYKRCHPEEYAAFLASLPSSTLT